MNTVKKNLPISCFLELHYLKDFIAKNYLRFLFTSFFLIAITAFSTIAILFYCDVFFDFGNYAKDRILKYNYWVLLVTPLFFWLSSFLCKKYAFNPYGAGLDNITFALKKLEKDPHNYKKVSNFLGFKVGIVIFFSSLVSTFGGGSLGREAPSILIAVCIFFASANYLRRYINQIELENWIFVGCAVGIAVAFNAPIAGMIYVLEKLIRMAINNSQKKHNFILPIFLSSSALIIVYFLMKNHCPTYLIKNFQLLSFKNLNYYLIISLTCSGLVYLMLIFAKYYYLSLIKINNKYWHLIPIFLGFIVALIGLFFGVFSIGGGVRSVNEALVADNIIYGYKELIGRYFSTILTYISGNAGGLVAPSIALGNLVGSVYAKFISTDPKGFMLIGMVAFLSPVLGAPLASAMVIVESTKIAGFNFIILGIISSISYFIVLLIQKLGAKIRVKLFKPNAN